MCVEEDNHSKCVDSSNSTRMENDEVETTDQMILLDNQHD